MRSKRLFIWPSPVLLTDEERKITAVNREQVKASWDEEREDIAALQTFGLLFLLVTLRLLFLPLVSVSLVTVNAAVQRLRSVFD